MYRPISLPTHTSQVWIVPAWIVSLEVINNDETNVTTISGISYVISHPAQTIAEMIAGEIDAHQQDTDARLVEVHRQCKKPDYSYLPAD